MQAQMKLFRAERNTYITGFSLFMLLLLRRLMTLISKQAHLEAINKAIESQAKGASEQAKKLLSENEELSKGSGGKVTQSSEESETEKKELLGKIEDLKGKLNTSTEKLEKAEKDLGAMKMQSEGLHREYDRILDEHNRLEKKLSILGDVSSQVSSHVKDD